MSSAIVSIIIAIAFIAWVLWYSPYGSQHEPMDWLIWGYQNLGFDL
tara:strand:+ start:420 stop:557 length:138 start_codon:yes stop_codon:yes gene_type:complete